MEAADGQLTTMPAVVAVVVAEADGHFASVPKIVVHENFQSESRSFVE